MLSIMPLDYLFQALLFLKVHPALISKLETLCFRIAFRLYIAVNGLEKNIFKINFQSFWTGRSILTCPHKQHLYLDWLRMQKASSIYGSRTRFQWKPFQVITTCITFNGAFLLGQHPPHISFSNSFPGYTRHILNLYILTGSEGRICFLSVRAVTAILTPFIRQLHDPSQTQGYNIK